MARKTPLPKTLPSAADPTLPTKVVTIDDKEYRLCLDFGVLIDTEDALIKAGHDVSLMLLWRPLTVGALREFFAIAVQRFHPELPYKDALKLITPYSCPAISDAIAQLWVDSMPKAKAGAKVDPLPAAK